MVHIQSDKLLIELPVPTPAETLGDLQTALIVLLQSQNDQQPDEERTYSNYLVLELLKHLLSQPDKPNN